MTKLEKFIEDYGKQGYILTKVYSGGCKFEFEKTSPDGFVPKIRIDYHTFRNKSDFQDYVAIFEDSGWHHLYGTLHTGYQYFKQSSPDVTDDIFSDRSSKAERYKRIANYWFGIL